MATKGLQSEHTVEEGSAVGPGVIVGLCVGISEGDGEGAGDSVGCKVFSTELRSVEWVGSVVVVFATSSAR